MIFQTKDDNTPLYNREGKVHGSSPWRQLTIDVQGSPVRVGDRGMAYQLTHISNAYVLVSDLVSSAPPPPPDTTIVHVISVYSDGSITIDGNPYP